MFFSGLLISTAFSLASHLSVPTSLVAFIPENFSEVFTAAAHLQTGKMRRTDFLTVTSYNPDCRQTKGGVLGEDGLCHSVDWRPCAFRNGAETCGNPCVGHGNVNLCTMKRNGIRPIAVTQDLPELSGKIVFAECWKDGKRFYDARCNGPFLVHDYKHERFMGSVDIFMMNRSENIGAVAVRLKYPVEHRKNVAQQPILPQKPQEPEKIAVRKAEHVLQSSVPSVQTLSKLEMASLVK